MWLKNNILNIFILEAKTMIVLAFLCLINFCLIGQTRVPDQIPFKDGEQLNYDAYYNLNKLWVPAGKVRFEVTDSVYNGKNCFMLDGKGKSLKTYDYFFKVRDRYTSIVDQKTLEPQRFVRQVNEGGFSMYYDYKFDNEKHQAVVQTDKKDPSKKQTIAFPINTYDVITAVYYARTLDFSDMKINDTIPLQMMIDKQIYDSVYIRYTGKAQIEGGDGKLYNCIKFRPLLIEGTMFEDGEYMEVFVTDDKNHIPIYIEAQIIVGSVRAYITSYKNVKYPLTSIVTKK
jgi:hypothetical protein